eukprot:2362401-Prymnesium_polylepis.1
MARHIYTPPESPGSLATSTPVELLQLYSSIGCAEMQPLMAGLHSPHHDLATQTLLDADKQYVRGGTEPL